MKFNKKGQGALEYLLLIGGAVLIAVIVIALLVGMGSQNSENSKTRNEEAMDAINIPVPSVINTVTCSSSGQYVVNWTAVNKTQNSYELLIDYVVDDVSFGPTINPIVSTATDCGSGKVVMIKTANLNSVGEEISVLSSAYTVK